MDEWIKFTEQYLEPISDVTPMGGDPRYSEDFGALKSEIEKKSSVDYEKINSLCDSILKSESKDLRVGSFLVLSLARLEGISGLIKGMSIISKLIEQFGDQLHPAKPKARLSAIKWFQQEKVLTFAQNSTNNVSYEEAVYAIEVYDELFEKIASYCGEPLSWPALKKWLAEKEKESALKVSKQTQSDSENTQAVNNLANAPVSTKPSENRTSTINSSAEYIQSVRQLLLYFKEQKLYNKMFGVACACQLGGLKLPPNEQGKTRLPPPRDTSMTKIRNAMDNEQWEEGLLASLDAFMEPSGQYSLDILKMAFDCSTKAGDKETATVIKEYFRITITRLPKLLQAKFDNDESFVSSGTAAWLEQINQSTALNEGTSAGGFQSYLAEARNVLLASSIKEAFEALDNMPKFNELQRAYIEFCKAQLCVEQDRSELALPIFLQLEQVVERLSLAQVDPEFAMQIWRQLHRLQNDRLAILEQDSMRCDTEKHIVHLQSLMCTTDVASAMQWL
ncbi:TssA family type VI secretion system protein [Reinekea forsetii]|nr:TssA family type VI secretion system protein [Reinekea forsetii]